MKQLVNGCLSYPRAIGQPFPPYGQTFARTLCYVICTALESVNKEAETVITFSKLQSVYVKNIQEAVAVTVADNNNELDIALVGLIISLLANDTSRLLLYKSPVMHYLTVRGINHQTKRF